MYASVFNDVNDNGEMGVSKDHLEFESGGHTSDHVFDCALDRSQSSVTFLLLEPHSEFDGALFALI